MGMGMGMGMLKAISIRELSAANNTERMCSEGTMEASRASMGRRFSGIKVAYRKRDLDLDLEYT